MFGGRHSDRVPARRPKRRNARPSRRWTDPLGGRHASDWIFHCIASRLRPALAGRIGAGGHKHMVVRRTGSGAGGTAPVRPTAMLAAHRAVRDPEHCLAKAATGRTPGLCGERRLPLLRGRRTRLLLQRLLSVLTRRGYSRADAIPAKQGGALEASRLADECSMKVPAPVRPGVRSPGRASDPGGEPRGFFGRIPRGLRR